MKKILLLILFICFTKATAQINIYFDNETPISSTEAGATRSIHFYISDPAIDDTSIMQKDIVGKDIFNENCNNTGSKEEVKLGNKSLSYTIDCVNKKVVLFHDGKTYRTYVFRDGEFMDTNEPDDPEPELEEDILFFPLNLNSNEPELDLLDKKNRVLILDANSKKSKRWDKTGLYKFVTEKKKDTKESNDPKGTNKTSGKSEDNVIRKSAQALPVNSYLSVFIENYNFHDLEQFTITVNAENYSYDQDLKKVYDLVVIPDETPAALVKEANRSLQEQKQEALKIYLDKIIKILKKYKYLNLNDLNKVQEYKLTLKDYYTKNTGDFDDRAKTYLQYIYSWYPKYVSLTPISIEVPDRDEVEISYTIKNKGSNSQTKPLGTFKTFGGVSVDYGAAFYLTNLKNNEVYTKTTGTAPDEDTRAVLASSSEQSVGFGLNIDVSYRTGIHFRPTFNFGFFVPLEEEVSPFIATGPGIGFYSKNYKINFSYGLAIGKVNSIKEQYRDINLADLDPNTDLTEKVLKTGYYFSLSLSFNVF